MGQSFYRHTETCILVFDLTVAESFKNVEKWRKEFLSSLNPPDADVYPFILVGNKCDIKESIHLSQEDITAYCKEHNNMPYFETSAKDNINLEETFDKAVDMAYERNSKNDPNYVPPQTNYIKIAKEEPEKGGCCGKKKA